MNKRVWAVGLVLVVAIAVIVGVAAYAISRNGWTKPDPVAEDAPSGLAKFYSQDVSWSSCGDAKCATVKVPVDYDDPGGETTKLSVKVIPSTGGTAKHSIFVNPGGPGGDATDFADTMADKFGSDIHRQRRHPRELRHRRRRPAWRRQQLDAGMHVGRGLLHVHQHRPRS